MENNFIKPMYKPPKVTVVQFQIESGFAGSGLGQVNFFHGIEDMIDNTTAYIATSNSGSSFWGGDATSLGSGGTSGGTSSYDFSELGW